MAWPDFVRFKKSTQKSISEILKDLKRDNYYQMEHMQPVDGSIWTDILDANWKSVRDVDNEGYHVRQAHPSLFDLYGQDTTMNLLLKEPQDHSTFNTKPSKKWSVKRYRHIVENNNWLKLPKLLSRSWIYFGMFLILF